MTRPFRSSLTVSPTLVRLLVEARAREVTEADLREQRISFAYGNALESDLITKASVRETASRIRLRR